MQGDAATNSCYVHLRRHTTGDLSTASVKCKLPRDFKPGSIHKQSVLAYLRHVSVSEALGATTTTRFI